MTDATLPVTGRAVERFVEGYVSSLGGSIQKDGSRWTVSLPDGAETSLELDGAVLEVVDDPSEVSEEALAVAPESPFVERLLDEAADRTPVGSLSLTGENTPLRLPDWIDADAVDVARAFTPYYDRRALCAIFHVGIETVSEYQREELCAVAIDLNDAEERPRLAETYLDLAQNEASELESGRPFDREQMVEALEVAHESVEREVSETVETTRERATRAAEVELDEYRQFVRQRRDELTEELANLTDRIDDVNDTIETTTEQAKRVEALRKRKELQAEADELRSERDSLSAEIEAGFPEERRDIRERHALTVRIRPVVATSLSYERGDLDLEVRSEGESLTASYSYAVGTGVLEDANCERCGSRLTGDNLLTIRAGQAVGSDCCSE